MASDTANVAGGPSVFGRRLQQYELLIFAVLFVLLAITLAASVVLADPSFEDAASGRS